MARRTKNRIQKKRNKQVNPEPKPVSTRRQPPKQPKIKTLSEFADERSAYHSLRMRRLYG